MKQLRSRRQLRIEIFACLALAALVVYLSVYSFVNLTTSSLWLDELASVFFADPDEDLRTVFSQRMVQDTSPPLYYLVLRYWLMAFENDEFYARLLSWIFAILCLAVTFLIGKRLTNTTVAWIISALIFIAPGTVQYSLEARSYSLLILASSLLIFQALLVCEQISRDSRLDRANLVWFIRFGLLASFTHYFGLILYAVLGVYVAIQSVSKRVEVRRVLIYGFESIVIIGLWLAITYRFVTHRLGTGSGAAFSSDWTVVLPNAMTLAFGSAYIAIFFLSAGAVALASRRGGVGEWHRIVLPISAVVGVVVVGSLVSGHTPMMTDRNFLVLLPALIIVGVLAFDRLVPLSQLAVGATLLGAVLSYFASEQVSVIKSEMRESAAFIASQPGCDVGTFVVVPGLGRGDHHFRYYLPAPAASMLIDKRSFTEQARETVFSQQCPVVLWLLHWTGEVDGVLRGLKIDRDDIEIIPFKGASVVVRKSAGQVR